MIMSEPVNQGFTNFGGQGTFSPETAPTQNQKSSKKMFIIGGAIIAAVAVIAVIIVLLIPSRFESARKEAVNIAGQITKHGDDSFTIDTYPYEDTNMSASLINSLAGNTQSKALEAIKYVNKELGFDSSLYDQMLETSARMGRQSASNEDYRVTWTYHPDEGLEVTYTEK